MYEERDYEEGKWVVTTVTGKNYKDASSEGFLRLFKYIAGTNQEGDWHDREGGGGGMGVNKGSGWLIRKQTELNPKSGIQYNKYLGKLGNSPSEIQIAQ